VATDVTSEDEVQAAVDAATDLGGLHIAVNCAGVGTPGRVVGKKGPLPLEQFAQVVTINLVGTFNVTRLAAARMLEAEAVAGERGVVVNTASIAAFDGQVGQAAYAASKGGVVGMTLSLARDLADKQIRVMTIAPGTFATPMLAGLPQEAQDSLAAQIPHPNRMGDPAEFGALVRHIVENPMLNGEVIRLDGALRMGPR
jgi:NAD(P)-dependent dehydrogenase (short-subunit alcohol dehydrogenase family)